MQHFDSLCLAAKILHGYRKLHAALDRIQLWDTTRLQLELSAKSTLAPHATSYVASKPRIIGHMPRTEAPVHGGKIASAIWPTVRR